MVSLADSLVASSSRPLGLRMRPDLTARRQRYQGQTYWVVKEPVGLKYFRFQEEEYAVLQMLTGDASLDDVKQQFEAEFPPHKITFQDLQQFVGTLHRSGLVVSDSAGQGVQLKKRGDERSRKELMGKLSNVLAIRFKGIDPERLLDFMYPWIRWLLSPVAAGMFIAIAIAALLLIMIQFDVFRSRLPAFDEFFGPKNWIYLGLTLAVTKVIHEFGHGLMCKHFGGECHEMGVMFLVLTPCLYCNVSDSWMLPSKWQRAAIGAAGIYVELIMASLATFVWWFSEPGLLNHLALRVMFICSISTVLFNGNPLLRFDGYYILADLIEIPNLRQKASKILQRMAAEHCLGLEMPEDPFLPQGNQFLFALYTVAAVAYRWFVFFSILFFLNKVFEPYGLKIIGQILAIMGLFGLVVQPLIQLFKFLHIPGRIDQVKWQRVAITACVVFSLIAGVLLVPLPRYVTCSLQLEPQDAESVYVVVPGKVETVHFQPGDKVAEGDIVCTLKNQDLTIEIETLKAQLRQYEVQLANLRRLSVQDVEANAQIAALAATARSVRDQLDERMKDWERLELEARVGGTVIAPPYRKPSPGGEGSLESWYGTPLEKQNLGAHLQVSELVCRIGDPQRLEAVLAIDQNDIDFVREQQAVEIKLESFPSEEFTGVIEQISERDMQYMPPSLSNQAGGGVATVTDESGMPRPLYATYQARVPMENSDGLLQAGCRGRARVKVEAETIGRRLGRYLARTFHFYL